MIRFTIFGFLSEYIKIDLFYNDTMILFLLILFNTFLVNGSLPLGQNPKSDGKDIQNDQSRHNNTRKKTYLSNLYSADLISTEGYQSGIDILIANAASDSKAYQNGQNNDPNGKIIKDTISEFTEHVDLNGEYPFADSVPFVPEKSNKYPRPTIFKPHQPHNVKTQNDQKNEKKNEHNSSSELKILNSQKIVNSRPNSSQSIDSDKKHIYRNETYEQMGKNPIEPACNDEKQKKTSHKDIEQDSPIIECRLYCFRRVFDGITYSITQLEYGLKANPREGVSLKNISFIMEYLSKHQLQSYLCSESVEYILDKTHSQSLNGLNTISFYSRCLTMKVNKANEQSSSQKKNSEFSAIFVHLKEMNDINKIKNEKIIEVVENKKVGNNTIKILVKCLDMEALEKKYTVDKSVKADSEIKTWSAYIFLEIVDGMLYKTIGYNETAFKLTFRLTYKHFLSDEEHKNIVIQKKYLKVKLQTFFFYIKCDLKAIYNSIFVNFLEILGIENNDENKKEFFIFSFDENPESPTYFTLTTRNFMIVNMFNYGEKKENTVLYCILSFKATKSNGLFTYVKKQKKE